MPAFFASDVHLRIDRPERGRRFARWVDELTPDDTLVIVGDLCDFWFASRQVGTDLRACPGLHALAAFRSRGGTVTILPGNHDAWLGPFYESVLGADFVAGALDVEAHGLRVHLVHGHLLRAGRRWKACMESRAFQDAFHHIPAPMAHGLDWLLEQNNERNRAEADRRHLALYREYASARAGTADIVVLGHVHTPVDDATARPRMIVLGGWHRRSSFLRIDDSGATFIVRPDSVPDGSISPPPSEPSFRPRA